MIKDYLARLMYNQMVDLAFPQEQKAIYDKCMHKLKSNPIRYRKYKQIKKDYRKTLKGGFIKYKHGAKYRNIKWEFTLEDFKYYFYSKCNYCQKEECKGIDRVDSDKNYTKNNCVPCCWTCNRMKGVLSVKEFKNHVRKLSEIFQCSQNSTS